MTKELESLDEVFEYCISHMESEGIDFREEAGQFELDYTPREDLKIVVTIVNKDVASIFEEAENLYGGLH